MDCHRIYLFGKRIKVGYQLSNQATRDGSRSGGGHGRRREAAHRWATRRATRRCSGYKPENSDGDKVHGTGLKPPRAPPTQGMPQFSPVLGSILHSMPTHSWHFHPPGNTRDRGESSLSLPLIFLSKSRVNMEEREDCQFVGHSLDDNLTDSPILDISTDVRLWPSHFVSISPPSETSITSVASFLSPSHPPGNVIKSPKEKKFPCACCDALFERPSSLRQVRVLTSFWYLSYIISSWYPPLVRLLSTC